MKHYTVYDSSGSVVRVGMCQAKDFKAQAQPGETVVEGMVTPEPPKVTYNYTYNRMLSYPSIGNQLDAIYKLTKALQSQGIELPPDTLVWLNEIEKVKDAFPKGGA